jgi:hypothetical protein
MAASDVPPTLLRKSSGVSSATKPYTVKYLIESHIRFYFPSKIACLLDILLSVSNGASIQIQKYAIIPINIIL